MFSMSPVIKQARKVNKSLSQSWWRNFISSAFFIEVRKPKPVHIIFFRHLVEDQFYDEFKLT